MAVGPKVSEVPDLGRNIKKNFGDAPVIPLILIGIGGYLAWFGTHYWRDDVTVWPSDPVKDVLQGKGMPAPHRAEHAGADIPASDAAPGPPSTTGVAAGKAIADDALKYVGTRYVWGGSDPARGWDCSGMVNWVLCHDLGLDIPDFKGGTFGPQSGHGPVVSDYIAWSGVQAVGSTGVVQAGDLLAWGPDQHIGIAVSNTDFVSAQNPRKGTIKAPITGFSVTFPIVLRLKVVTWDAAGPGANQGLSRNQATAALLAVPFGWQPQITTGGGGTGVPPGTAANPQWDALVRLWNQESGWSNTAKNPSSGAYGIAQALPESKYPPAGQEAGGSSAAVQIAWGLAYIKTTYGDPVTAWAHEQQFGWY